MRLERVHAARRKFMRLDPSTCGWPTWKPSSYADSSRSPGFVLGSRDDAFRGVNLAGYSGTPLAKKLGLKENHRVAFVAAPPHFAALLGDLPPGTKILRVPRQPLDLVVLFATSRGDVIQQFERLARRLAPAGMLWVAWPKKSSGMATDLSEDRVRHVGLERGLVDTKVCTIDDIWSGLKFVIRLKDRPKTGSE
jgi:hypothetical protein